MERMVDGPVSLGPTCGRDRQGHTDTMVRGFVFTRIVIVGRLAARPRRALLHPSSNRIVRVIFHAARYQIAHY